MLEGNMHLSSLGLEWNSIGMVDSGLQRLCQAIARNSTLTELDLRNNGISAAGGAMLGEMLAKSTSLRYVDLRWNTLGASGGKKLLEGLQHNSSVLELMLTGNKVNDETLRSVDLCLHKNREKRADYIAESVMVQDSTPRVMLQDRTSRHNISPTHRQVTSPGRKMSPLPLVSHQADLSSRLSSPGRSYHTSRSLTDSESRSLSQASKLRNSVSGEALEHNFRDKLQDLSRALVSEKEANISLEKRYCDEVEYRATLEGKILEYERLLRTAEESLLHDKSLAEARESELSAGIDKERGLRQVSDQQLLSVKIELSELQSRYQEDTRESERRLHGLEEQKQALDRRQQRLAEDLRQTESQREHLDTVYHASVARVAELDRNVQDLEAQIKAEREEWNVQRQTASANSQSLGLQVQTLKDKLSKETSERSLLEDSHLREKRALNDRVRALSDSLQEEQSVLAKTKDELHTMTQGRDRLQTRLNHLSDEATELRKEFSAKRGEFETKLESEADLREKAEKLVAEKLSLYEQLRSHTDRYKDNMEKRVATLEKQVASKDHELGQLREELSTLKDEEAKRIVTLEDRLMHAMRTEIAKASPSKLKGSTPN